MRFGSTAPSSIWFVGDSTSRNLFQAWSVALHSIGPRRIRTVNVSVLHPTQGARSSAGARYAIFRVYVSEPANRATQVNARVADGLVLVSASSMWPEPRLLPALRAELADVPPPTSVIFSVGLWTMWPVPFSRTWTSFDHFHWYELELLACYDAAAAFGSVREVVFLPIHPICEARMRSDHGIWGLVSRAHTNDEAWAAAIGQCASWVVSNLGDKHRLSKPVLRRLRARSSLPTAPLPWQEAPRPTGRPMSRASAARMCDAAAHLGKAPARMNARIRSVVSTVRAASRRPASSATPARLGGTWLSAAFASIFGKVSSVLVGDAQRGERVVAPLSLMPPTDRLLAGRCDTNLGGDHLHFHSLIYDELAVTVDHLLRPDHSITRAGARNATSKET